MELEKDNESSRSKRTVRSTLIEPFKQIKLGLYVLVVTAVFLVVAGVLFVESFYDQYRHVMEIFNVVDPQTQWELVINDVFQANAIRLGVAFVSFLVILFWIIFKTTHRYYGPLVSIERFVKDITAGHYRERVNIRRGDELVRLVGLLNDMAAKLEERHGSQERRRDSSSSS